MAFLEDHARILVAHHYDMQGNKSPCLIYLFSLVKHGYWFGPMFYDFPWFSHFANFFPCSFSSMLCDFSSLWGQGIKLAYKTTF